MSNDLKSKGGMARVALAAGLRTPVQVSLSTAPVPAPTTMQAVQRAVERRVFEIQVPRGYEPEKTCRALNGDLGIVFTKLADTEACTPAPPSAPPTKVVTIKSHAIPEGAEVTDAHGCGAGCHLFVEFDDVSRRRATLPTGENAHETGVLLPRTTGGGWYDDSPGQYPDPKNLGRTSTGGSWLRRPAQ